MMQLLCYLALTLLCGLPLSSSVAALACKDTQYEWPLLVPKSCCNKCPPGTHLNGRNEKECKYKCKNCEDEMYRPTYNTDFSCLSCENCRRTNMEYLSPCNATHNAVCKCKPGYKCKALPCVQCLPIPTTTIATTLTPTTLTSPVITMVHSSTMRSPQRKKS
ncbi:tumor necrosis factor receptor superfamily member 3-like [Nelusetta ayraudi]|uniref:tumor necrosis factor receptor superfamily member 3-like n=1 Tax=Nelusetta ayraudi TaxID=303726 RepID=UPI003F7011AB